ncbi:hypothetical protein JOM56_002510 [Amanita muscaria]
MYKLASTATSLKALDRQESHTAYQAPTNPWISAGAMFQRDQNFNISGYPPFMDLDREVCQRRREQKGKANPSTAMALKALDRQESHTAYQDPTNRWDAMFQRDQNFNISGYPPFMNLGTGSTKPSKARRGTGENEETEGETGRASGKIEGLREGLRKLEDIWKDITEPRLYCYFDAL